MATLKGSPELKARLKALRLVFKPMGKDWAKATAEQSNRTAPVGVTGRLSKSHRVRSATQRRAIVDAIWYAKFVNRGTQPHSLKSRKNRGRTIFSKKNHPGMRGTRYVDKAAHGALKKHFSAARIIEAWNKAA